MTPSQEKLRLWRENPVQMVRDLFHVEPDLWQVDVLEAFASSDPDKIRISMQACAGPGKSTALAWCGWNFLLCYGEKGEHPKGACVSISQDNLRDNLWAEFSKWQNRSPLLLELFEWTQTRIFAKHHASTWFLSARSYSKSANPEEVGRTLSGLHSKFVLYLIDESGDIPPHILKSAEQGLSTGPKFGKILQAGNPTSREGTLYAAANELRSLWYIVRITGDPDDIKRSPRIRLEWAIGQIKQFGRDNPWVMAYILGMFPPGSINTLMTSDEVMSAMDRGIREQAYNFSQKRLGVDVARFGDDRTIIFPRQGLRAFKYVEMRNADNAQIAARVLNAKVKWGSESEFIDGTGGFGGGVVDFLKQSGTTPFEIHFSSKAIDPRYYNKRTEMWFLLSLWVKNQSSALFKDTQLAKELVAPTYTIRDGKLLLEPKELIKSRLGFSPDCGDALALTFAQPDMPAAMSQIVQSYGTSRMKSDYDPFKGQDT